MRQRRPLESGNCRGLNKLHLSEPAFSCAWSLAVSPVNKVELKLKENDDDDMPLFALGSNGHGQLSLGHTQDTAQASQCVLPDSLVQDRLLNAQLISGGNHSFLLAPTGQLYGCGANHEGQLGLAEPDDVLRFTELFPGKHWTHAACGFSYSLLVQDNRHVFAVGFNDKGSLGLGNCFEAKSLTELSLPDGLIVKDIKASVTHVVVEATDGSFYGFGAGRRGALGRNLMQQVDVPALMDTAALAEPVLDYCLGQHWTAFQTTTRVILWTTGSKHLQGGLLESCKALSASWSTLHRLLPSGYVQSHGRSDRAQHASKLNQITTIAAGSEHCLAQTTDGTAVAWGWNEHGNCGAAHLKDVRDPIQLGNEVQWIAAGYATSFFYTTAILR